MKWMWHLLVMMLPIFFLLVNRPTGLWQNSVLYYNECSGYAACKHGRTRWGCYIHWHRVCIQCWKVRCKTVKYTLWTSLALFILEPSFFFLSIYKISTVAIKHSSDICSYSVTYEILWIEWFAYLPDLQGVPGSSCATSWIALFLI